MKDKAKLWFNSILEESISTWDEMVGKFLTKYFPPVKAAKLRGDLTIFPHFDTKSVYEA